MALLGAALILPAAIKSPPPTSFESFLSRGGGRGREWNGRHSAIGSLGSFREHVYMYISVSRSST